MLSASHEQKEHGEEDEGKVNDLGLEVLLLEDHCSEEEADNY